MQSGARKNNEAEKELSFSRRLNAPIKLVWEVWTKAEHIQHWWGPSGFTNTIIDLNFEVGGEWNLIMHSPQGIDYSHKCVFKEIVKHKKIVCEQLTHPRYVATIEFEEHGNETSLHWQLLFESKEYLIHAAKTFKVDVGLKQNGEKLIKYLESVW